MDATLAPAPQNLRHPRRSVSLLPREHGAYGQLGLPLVTALALSPARGAALAVSLGAVAAFLAHEPLLVVTGGRGPRARRDHGMRALGAALGLGGVALALGAAGLTLAPVLARWSALPVVALAALCAWAALRGEERTTGGECLAALTLSAASVPVALAGGGGPWLAIGIGAAWALGSVVNTVAVRGLIARGKAEGSPVLARRAAVFGAVVALAALAGAWARILPLGVAMAVLPPAVVAMGLYARPIPVKKLRALGWTLVGAGLLSAAALVGL